MSESGLRPPESEAREDESGFAKTLAELRADFDESFSRAPEADRTQTYIESYLALRVGDEAFAIRLAETRGLDRVRFILPLPVEAGGLLGLAGIRDRLVPVYSLGVILGFGPPAARDLYRVVLAGSDQLIGFVFDEFSAYLQVPGFQTEPERDLAGRPERAYLREVLQHEGTSRYVIDLGAIVRSLWTASQAAP